MKKLLSYIYPITKKIASAYNGILEVTLVNGKKVLDSKNANYSFGSLKKILERGLYEIDLEGVSSVLVLGMGGGSIIRSLRDTFAYTGKIDAVEIDPVVIDIAKKEFGIQESEATRIFNVDAMGYVKQCTLPADIIIVDLFIDTRVPAQFYTVDFCADLCKIVSDRGSIIFNLGMNDIDTDKRAQVIEYFKNRVDFKSNLLAKVEGTNTVLIASKLGKI